jgi:LysW-gamma-L-alpha-aminoadipyl-6-phosphate/LysW-L-glutamyl-5-phosphate reductase
MSRIVVSILGGSGYAGGELLRLLLDHPDVSVAQVTSESNVGKFVHTRHPNLRRRTMQKFVSAADLQPCDVLFAALPHGQAMGRIDDLSRLAPRIVDLSADFRLRSPADYRRWYGAEHRAPAWLDRFVYGLPEINREAIRGATHVSGVGCNATATILALWPLFQADLVDRGRGAIVEVKVGSSEGGASAGPASHHPDRSHAVRSFAPTGHRHTAEVVQALRRQGTDDVPVHMSVTSIELVRGVLATAHAFLREELRAGFELKDLWRAYRGAYGQEPFVRLVREAQGVYRYPEPKILAGSNYADVGFDYDTETGRVVAIAAIDNLMKGAAGSAVQCMNLMCGLDETAGLGFAGLHPV